MKSNHVLLVMLSLLLPQLAVAQTWFEEGDTWVYNWAWWGNYGYDELKVAASPDTTINGTTCKKLESRLHYIANNGSGQFFIVDEAQEQLYFHNRIPMGCTIRN